MATTLLQRYRQDPQDFLARIVTQDETWAHHFDPETKQSSKEWRRPDESRPQMPLTSASAGKVMVSVFWDAQGVLLLDYLKKGSTVTGQYYASLIQKPRVAIKEKRRGKLSKGIMLLHDNAPPHTIKDTIHACGCELLSHPPYSPDLTPSDFHLFSHLKKHLRGQRFQDDGDVIAAVTTRLTDHDSDFLANGLKRFESRWQRCIDLDGAYVE